jgi:hypothetical protein
VVPSRPSGATDEQKEDIRMATMNRRSILALGLAGTSLGVLRISTAEAAVGEEKEVSKGVKVRTLGEGPSLLPGYSKVSLRDVIFEPGGSVPERKMMNAMVCHITQGELKIVQNGREFVAKKDHVWTCDKVTTEGATNAGPTVAIMRITDLLA